MKIAVMGAGAVGCYYGGMLARAGHDLTLIGRAQHVDALRRDGLLLDTRSFQARVPVRAETDARGVRGAAMLSPRPRRCVAVGRPSRPRSSSSAGSAGLLAEK